MRISDWSSDVCSSDLARDEARIGHEDAGALRRDGRGERGEDCDRGGLHHEAGYLEHDRGDLLDEGEHGGSLVVDQLLMSAAMCLISAWLAVKLHRACD